MWPAVRTLITKEFTLELRKKSVIAGIGLYLISLVFISYLAFNFGQSPISELTWAALLWITILFSTINSVAKSFIGEKPGQSIYYFSIASPRAIIISKICYNTILCAILAGAAYVFYQFFLPIKTANSWQLPLTIFLAAGGLSASLSLISSISAKTNNSNVLMAVLSFPVLIGILLMSIKITKNVLDQLDASASYDELLNLLAINCIMTGLAYLLFPYIWRS